MVKTYKEFMAEGYLRAIGDIIKHPSSIKSHKVFISTNDEKFPSGTKITHYHQWNPKTYKHDKIKGDFIVLKHKTVENDATGQSYDDDENQYVDTQIKDTKTGNKKWIRYSGLPGQR